MDLFSFKADAKNERRERGARRISEKCYFQSIQIAGNQ